MSKTKNKVSTTPTRSRSKKAPESKTKIDGPGFEIVDLLSASPSVRFLPSKVGTDLVKKLNDEWDDDIVDYSKVEMVSGGTSAGLWLAQILGSEKFDALARVAPKFHEALVVAQVRRRDYLMDLFDRDQPIPFMVLPELLFLWKGERIALRQGSAEFGGKLVSAAYRNTWRGEYIVITYETLVWRGLGLQPVVARMEFDRPVVDRRLADYGVSVNVSSESAERLIARGRRVVALNEACAYVQIAGNIERLRWHRWEQIPATGRAIVDQMGLGIFDPEFQRDMSMLYEDGGITLSVSGALRSGFTDADMFFVDPPLMVFSLVAKKWGRVSVDKVSDIVFRHDAFEKLVLPPEDKQLIYSLVKNTDPAVVSDVVDNKGGGCTLLLHGEPGLGKTLTAEAVAETQHRPLYVVSVGELGTVPEMLERKLHQALSTAHRWNAVLLLDEADVFLEARQSGDVHRNAMVSTFLRLLEYYNGVMVLTTNRVTDIDKAFYSRISLAFYYESFSDDTRLQVVKNLLAVNGVELSAEDAAKIAAHECNGRQLKNVIRQARFLAAEQQRAVTAGDVLRILGKLSAFEKFMAERRGGGLVTHPKTGPLASPLAGWDAE